MQWGMNLLMKYWVRRNLYGREKLFPEVEEYLWFLDANHHNMTDNDVSNIK